MKHGPGAYANGCRCTRCTDSWAPYQAEKRSNRERALAMGTAAPQHGRYSTYTNYGCRCAACSDAASDARKASR